MAIEGDADPTILQTISEISLGLKFEKAKFANKDLEEEVDY